MYKRGEYIFSLRISCDAILIFINWRKDYVVNFNTTIYYYFI